MHNVKLIGWIYVAIQFVLIVLVLAACYSDYSNIGEKGNAVSVVGLCIAMTGFVLMLITFFGFRQTMTPNPVPLKESSLRTTGVYKYVRHPMYSSVLFSLIGVVVYFKSISGSVIWILAVVFIIFKIRFEEKCLLSQFTDYASYASRTKKLVPFLY